MSNLSPPIITLQRVVTLTAAQLKALNTSPAVIVPAVTGKTILLLAAFGYFHKGNQAFSLNGSGAVLAYGDPTAAVSRAFGADGTVLIDQVSVAMPIGAAFNTVGVANVVGIPLVLADTIDAGPNGNGTMTITIIFAVV